MAMALHIMDSDDEIFHIALMRSICHTYARQSQAMWQMVYFLLVSTRDYDYIRSLITLSGMEFFWSKMLSLDSA